MNRESLIKDILYGYVKAPSITTTAGEIETENYFVHYFSKLEYFKTNPEYYGLYPIKNDPYGRFVGYALVKGKSNKTVVLLHHNDVVTIEDYDTLKDYAFDPDILYENFKDVIKNYDEDTQKDYRSGEWLFGRGVCDMKGGGAIEMALLSEYAEEELNGNVIVLAVPDEENLSAGMRSACTLLRELKDKYGFEYTLMIDTESHQRKERTKGILHLGSIGKVMPAVTVRGKLAHAGMMFDGINPCNLLSTIVSNTEANMLFADEYHKEVTPPPTWLYLRENKESYNVSMPLVMQGCLSVLTFDQKPDEVMAKLKKIASESFEEVLRKLNKNYHEFLSLQGKEIRDLPYKPKVVEFRELLAEAEADYPNFRELYEKKLSESEEAIREGRHTYISATFELTDWVLQYVNDHDPRVVIGLVPPYYPNVCLDKFAPDRKVEDIVRDFTKKAFNQEYSLEYYYTGISDLSYSSVSDTTNMKECLEGNMPYVSSSYLLPVEDMQAIAMPGINLGPWGKDLHRASERVYKQDLYVRTPTIIDHLIRELLK